MEGRRANLNFTILFISCYVLVWRIGLLRRFGDLKLGSPQKFDFFCIHNVEMHLQNWSLQINIPYNAVGTTWKFSE